MTFNGFDIQNTFVFLQSLVRLAAKLVKLFIFKDGGNKNEIFYRPWL